MTTRWSRDVVAMIAERPMAELPLVDFEAVTPILPGLDLWDHWPVQDRDGCAAEIAGGTLYMLLSAPALPDPEDRHAIARIRLMHHTAGGWRDLGNALPDGFAPGSREWSGSAIVNATQDRVSLYFTAAGHRGERVHSYDQRLFETSAELSVVDGVPRITGWTTPVESVVADGHTYARDMVGGGAIGTIKAFRDPAWFCDPADGSEFLVFAASLATSTSQWNGMVGLARREGNEWKLCPPLITADGVNNELERPHIVHHDGRYFCFWSTQNKVFAPDGPVGPTGLYGMVADHMAGPWAPLNETGLVFCNPALAPFQAYSWLVLGDLRVLSFLDKPGLSEQSEDTEITRRHFCGTPAAPIALLLRAHDDRAAPDLPST